MNYISNMDSTIYKWCLIFKFICCARVCASVRHSLVYDFFVLRLLWFGFSRRWFLESNHLKRNDTSARETIQWAIVIMAWTNASAGMFSVGGKQLTAIDGRCLRRISLMRMRCEVKASFRTQRWTTNSHLIDFVTLRTIVMILASPRSAALGRKCWSAHFV